MRKGTRIAASIAGGALAGGLAFGATHFEDGHDTGAQRIEAEVIRDAGPFVIGALEAWMISEGIEETERRRWEAEPSEPPLPPSLHIVPRLPYSNSDHPPVA